MHTATAPPFLSREIGAEQPGESITDEDDRTERNLRSATR